MRTRRQLVLVVAGLACSWPGGDLSAASLMLRGAVVHCVVSPTLERGDVYVVDGRIEAVGKDLAQRADEEIDLAGLHVYPGLINPATSLGLVEIEAVRATRDMAEVGEYKPELKAWLAVNPDSEQLPVARANGFTHAVTVPMGEGIAGQSGLMRLEGWTVEDRLVRGPAGMHLFWPGMALDTTPKEEARDPAKWKSLEAQARERERKLAELDEFFRQAEAYAGSKQSGAGRVPAWEAMVPVVRGEVPLVVHADEVQQIRAVLRWSEGRRYRVVLAGGRDSWRVAGELSMRGVPVIFDRVFYQSNPQGAAPMREIDAYDVNYRAPGVLARAGVKVLLGEGLGADAASNARNVPYAAAQAVAFGMDPEAALKAITLHPAEVYGVADRLGGIAPGREASLFVATGDIFDIRSRVTRMWIGGRAVELGDRQTRLYERYRGRPRR